MLERRHRLARLGDPRQNLSRVNKQSFAGFGQNHRARQSIEQLLVEFLFQLMDLLTERRLRDMLAVRRVGEATLLRDSDKVPKLMNLHRAILGCERRFVEAADRRSRHVSSSHQPGRSSRVECFKQSRLNCVPRLSVYGLAVVADWAWPARCPSELAHAGPDTVCASNLR